MLKQREQRQETAIRIIGRHPVGTFLVWFFTVGQAIAFTPYVARQFFGTEWVTEPFLIAAALVGLTLPTLVITWITDGPEGLRAMRRRILAVDVPARWYGFALVVVPLAVVAVWAAASGAPDQTSSSAIGSALGLGYLLQVAVLLVTVNMWEEIGWAGFVQPRLQERHGPLRAAVVTGTLFALGHLSQVIEEGSLSAVLVLMALLVAVCIPFRALQGWVYNRTHSLVPVALVHAAGNATAAGSVLGAGLLDRLYPDDAAGGIVFPVLGALGVVVIVATRGRLGLPRRGT